MAESTRGDIVAAATRLFLDRGWAGASVRDIAREAGCAVETVYASVGGKRELLKVALDIGVVGDHEPIPFLERPELQVVAEGRVRERAMAGARLAAAIYRRTAALQRVLDQARRADAELAEVWATTRRDYRVSVEAMLIRVAGRPLTATELDAMAAVLGHTVYLQLTEESRWTDEQYATWAAEAIVRLLALDQESPSCPSTRKPPPTPE